MTQTTRCKVCRSSHLQLADALINQAVSDPKVAATIGVSTDSVYQHRTRGHVAPAAKTAARGSSSPVERSRLTNAAPTDSTTAAATDPSGVAGDALDGLKADLAILNAMDPTTMSPAAAMNLISERRRMNVEIARLQPPVVLAPEPKTARELVDTLFGALREDVQVAAYDLKWRVLNEWRVLRGLGPHPEDQREAVYAMWAETSKQEREMEAKRGKPW